MKYILTIIITALCAHQVDAQITTTLPIDTAKQKKHKSSISIGSGGFQYSSGMSDSSDRAFDIQYGMLDLGINSLIDNTNYSSAAAGNLFWNANMQPTGNVNADVFSLRAGKSINVNVYPIMVKARLYRSLRQRITLATGLGLQMYNFRFTRPVTYVSGGNRFNSPQGPPDVYVRTENITFSKNKLAFNYLTVPLMINFKTRIATGPDAAPGAGVSSGRNSSTYGRGYWLTYGVGISGGYLLSSWTKQVSDERGKEKNHDPFNFRKTNLCVNGEIGLDGYIRLYASYQLTSLHENGLDQHPLSIGIRFLGL